VHNPTPEPPIPPATFTRPDTRPKLVALDPDDARPVWVPELWDARRLMDTDFPVPRWAVPGIICEGLSLLAGPPKVGKSWLSLDLALSIAAGGTAFGAIPVRSGPVLYLALEDTPRRLKSRVGKLLGDRAVPAGLDIATDWPTLPAGGDVAIAAWLDAHPDARLVVVDVFAKVRGPVPAGMSAYDADYAAVGRAKRIADNYGIAMVMVHHVRKAGSEDFLQEVSGTNGIAGAADATMVLKRARGTADGVLHITGRDVEEAEHALSIDPDTRRWLRLDGPAAEHQLGDTRAAILAHLRDSGPAAPKTIADAIGLSHESVKKTCKRMADDGQLHADAAGRYAAPNPAGTGYLPGVPGVPGVPETR
jgi:AAA domain